MKRFLVKRPEDSVEVLLLSNKDGSGYQYINLSKGHICPCKFGSEQEAITDLKKEVVRGNVSYFIPLCELEVKTC